MFTPRKLLTYLAFSYRNGFRSATKARKCAAFNVVQDLYPQSLSQEFFFSTRQDDGYDSNYWNSPSRDRTYGRRQHGFRNRSSRPPWPELRKKRFQNGYGDEFSDSEFGSPMQKRRQESELGANIRSKEWGDLPPIEKNFYVESGTVKNQSEEEIKTFYDTHKISVTRGDRPLPVAEFHEANFPEKINERLVRTGWTQPTPIQSLGWPLALSGKNMVAIAQTGSGKTLGFILPGLIHIKHQRQVAKGEGPIVLVLAPTRELAQQIKSVAVEYGRLLGIRSCAVFGGQSKLVQARHLSEGPEIVIATPGRLLDFLEMEVINLDRTSYVVLDEADRMLDMGFEPQIRKVLDQIRPDRQMLMWSATWPQEIQQLAHDFLGEFTQVNIGSTELTANPNIKQIVKVCERKEKFNLLVEELESYQATGKRPLKTLIFAQTKSQADFLTHRLRKLRFRALSIHGDKSQLVRDKTLNSFRNDETEILVATDVASRGLDVNDIKLVINYDYPNGAEDYIHRIGRTGRAEKTGTALTFVTDDDASKLDDLINVLKDAKQEIPEDLSNLARLNAKLKRKGSFSKSNYHHQSNHSRRKPYSSDFKRRNSW
ncbi:Dead (asp-glu-ala-asp) box helicase 5 [Plakobranchus ocellatus]|uniref:RNA helicase n=1 Tax=Plakobranchus ocellatus TaxID=259542 RepID=A0AAV4BDC4_9GAST|nr:Dead (asp-glu-ala-asp) box helicase 5 [Plakobranchus ocellatus]